MLDQLEDPHNLGAILRSADAFSVDGIIIPKNRSVHLNSTVAKVSTGAIEHVDVIEVTNLTNTIKELKQNGVFQTVEGGRKYDKKLMYFFATIEKNRNYYVFQLVGKSENMGYLKDDFFTILKSIH